MRRSIALLLGCAIASVNSKFKIQSSKGQERSRSSVQNSEFKVQKVSGDRVYNGIVRIDLFFLWAMVQQVQSLSIDDSLLYPDSDGRPVADNTTQLRLIFTIKGGLDALFKDRDDVFIAADLLWYPVQLTQAEIRAEKKPKKQAPDVMVVFGRPKGERGSYMQWQEDDIAPQVAFEILSPSNRKEEMQTKFDFYQEHGIEEYYLYDPKKNRLQGWLRRGEKLEAIRLKPRSANARMEDWRSPLLGIRLSTREGELVLFHPDGERFVDYVEVVEQRDRQQQRAILAEDERDRALETADRERQEKERERQEKERERQRANDAEVTIQQLRDRLLKLGVDPNTL